MFWIWSFETGGSGVERSWEDRSIIVETPVLNFRLSQRRKSVSSTAIAVVVWARDRDWRLTCQTKGEIKIREMRGTRERGELRDWDKMRIRMMEKDSETAGFWVKAVINKRK